MTASRLNKFSLQAQEYITSSVIPVPLSDPETQRITSRLRQLGVEFEDLKGSNHSYVRLTVPEKWNIQTTMDSTFILNDQGHSICFFHSVYQPAGNINLKYTEWFWIGASYTTASESES
jgi:hypothetical protein